MLANANSKIENKEVVFDEDFGYTNKIFDRGVQKGQVFKDVKAKFFSLEYLKGLPEEHQEKQILEFILNNPDDNEAKIMKRALSIGFSQVWIWGLFGYSDFDNVPPCLDDNKETMYYVLTGKKLEKSSDDEFSKKSETELADIINQKADKIIEKK